MILKALSGRVLDSNCYIVASEKTRKGLIIDPSADADAIHDIVGELDLSISLMVATHAHIDHIFEAARIKQELDVDLAIHEAEANMEIWSRD